MAGKASELTFQNDIIQQLLANGWLLGKPENYNRELALYEEDLLGFVKETQDAQWRKFSKLYPNNPEQKFLERVANQLNKAYPYAPNKEMRTFGTLGELASPWFEIVYITPKGYQASRPQQKSRQAAGAAMKRYCADARSSTCLNR